MNISKFLLLSTAFVTSIASAESIRVQMNYSDGDASEHLEQVVVDLQEGQTRTVHSEASRKVECEKVGTLYKFTVSVKDESGEWKVVCTPELELEDSKGNLEVTNDKGSVFSLAVEKVTE